MEQETSITNTYERHDANLRQVAKLNKATVLDALAAAGITSVCADFDGEGDSGGITNVSAYQGNTGIALPGGKIAVHHAAFGSDQPVVKQETLREAIESLCYDYLTAEHGGWENNDGGFGAFTFNVAARTVELEFNDRYVEFQTTTHEF